MNAPTSNARYVANARTVPEGIGLSVSSVASVQFGAAIAAHLFPLVGPLGTVSLRLAGASLVLMALTRPWRRRWVRAELGASVLFGLIFVVMNSSLYLALDRLPLATVVTIEFLGPLTLSIVTARSWRERVWAMPAAAGVAAIGGALATHDGARALAGIAFALTAALGWAAYIVMSGRVGRTGTGLAGLSLANAVAAVVVLPFGLATAGSALWRPSTLAIGLVVGVLSSAIPYSFDLLSLRRLPTVVFGVLTSLNPAVAALAGLAGAGPDVADPPDPGHRAGHDGQRGHQHHRGPRGSRAGGHCSAERVSAEPVSRAASRRGGRPAGGRARGRHSGRRPRRC